MFQLCDLFKLVIEQTLSNSRAQKVNVSFLKKKVKLLAHKTFIHQIFVFLKAFIHLKIKWSSHNTNKIWTAEEIDH